MDAVNDENILTFIISYLVQLENMKYVLVTSETDSLLVNAPPCWYDVLEKLPELSEIKKQGSCCTALANIVRRLNHLPIPGNILGEKRENCVGGTDSWFKYLNNSGRLQEINLLKEYPRGTMLIQKYNPIDQGHIAIVIESNTQGLLLSKIIHNVGAKKRQYNKTVIELFKDYFYCARFTHVCLPKNWIFRL